MTAVAEMISRDRDMEIAKNLLIENIPIKIIIKTTGLDEPTIQRLQAELNNE